MIRIFYPSLFTKNKYIAMARRLRIEFSSALYHLTARGNARQDIFIHDDDRHDFLELLSRANERYHWLCHAYCLMSNHYHLLIETRQPTLSKGMKYIKNDRRMTEKNDRVWSCNATSLMICNAFTPHPKAYFPSLINSGSHESQRRYK